jgi:hypothetical protein
LFVHCSNFYGNNNYVRINFWGSLKDYVRMSDIIYQWARALEPEITCTDICEVKLEQLKNKVKQIKEEAFREGYRRASEWELDSSLDEDDAWRTYNLLTEEEE